MNHRGWIKWLVIDEPQKGLKVGTLFSQKNNFIVSDPQPLLDTESAKGNWS